VAHQKGFDKVMNFQRFASHF